MKILVAGDYCPQQRVSEFFDKNDFGSVLGNIQNVNNQADYAIVNFECSVCYGEETPIEKCGPNLRCNDNGVDAIKWAGFDCVTLANNHFYDYGDKGVQNTLDKCKALGIDTVGGGMNLKEASSILYKEIGEKTLAIINCCEHEFSIASESHGGSNPLNPVQQYYAIAEASKKADSVLVVVHGGHEHWQLPSPRMQETYRFFINAGADAVVNHHQHCYSGYEYYKGKPIVYGLGNFCFDEGLKKDMLWHDGYMVMIDFDNKCMIDLYPYRQCAEEADVIILKDRKIFDSEIEKLNVTIKDCEKLKKEQSRYYEKSIFSYQSLFDPINLRYVRAFQHRGWLPFMYSNKKLMQIINYISCESQRDKLLFALNSKSNNRK